jgi:hypothetical protein
MTSVYVDGDIFVVDHGAVARYVSGSSEGWSTKAPGDELLRSAPRYSLVASAADRRSGLLYAYDDLNGRVVAFDKASGAYREQYLIAAGGGGLRDVRGMYVLAAVGTAPATLVWVTSHEIHQAALVRAPDALASPSPPLPAASGSPGPSGSIAAASGS